MRQDIERDYFEWLCEIIRSDGSYQKVLWHLFKHIRFVALIERDENRASDGINMRYKFARESGYSYAALCDALDDRDCSMLEMMVALAVRCEDNLMHDFSLGDRTYIWFWDMMRSLGLDEYDDYRYSNFEVDKICQAFMDRKYSSDGNGSLFYIPNCDRDLRTVEIWYQMCWYLNEMYLN